ncbi:ammonium transporter [Limnospira indica]|uniref:ammonium transporter n=1 Tax=Limnospira indica TaxID=147322 RepID=UPI001862C794|nr:ammonium transporter [Limnospira indica]QNH57044.1 MAG: ammonium transporter [Limnospira indica BM01]
MNDLIWLLICSSLVFLMQPGFMCLESGLTRSKNSINVAIKNLADFGISVWLFWAIGYGLMFGTSQLGLFGSSYFVLDVSNIPSVAALFLFQTMFCSTATTIVSGAVAERMRFQAYLIVAGFTSGLIYPIFGHWAWNGLNNGVANGWLDQLGFIDFAGSTVVHSIGGWVALAALLVIGPRSGRFPQGKSPRKIHGSNLPLSVLGVMLLWIGWLGFNGGSALVVNDKIPVIIVNTILGGVAGMLVNLFVSLWRTGWVEIECLINGSLAGLVAITASCNAVGTLPAIIIGALGAIIATEVSKQLVRWGIDDAVDAVAVHVGAGVWGTLAVGLFGRLDVLNTGLNRFGQIAVQVLGIVSGAIRGFLLSLILLLIINKFYPLRVSEEGENMGLNIYEHRAKTDSYELFKVMDFQAQTKDLSLRVPVEPFTEVGQIASRYNYVMDALEAAVRKTEAIVETATDAILTFTVSSLVVLTANPSAEAIFGYGKEQLIGMEIRKLVRADDNSYNWDSLLIEKWLKSPCQSAIGWRADGSQFPV